VGAVPVYFALRHKSVRASVYCQSPSAVVSMNPSNTNNLFSCSGVSPGYWRTHDWNDVIGFTKEQLFRSVFGTDPLTSYLVSNPDKLTLFEVVNLGGNEDRQGGTGTAVDDTAELSSYFVAALCNYASRRVPEEVLSFIGLVEMWTAVSVGGVYEPYPGIEWGPAEVKRYLASTWGESWS